MEALSKVDKRETLSKQEIIDLINDDGDQLFGLIIDNQHIRFKIYYDLLHNNLIESDHEIEIIEELDRTLIKANRIQDHKIIKDISFPATRNLVFALTKDVGIDFDKNALEQARLLLAVCLKTELDKVIFKVPPGNPSK